MHRFLSTRHLAIAAIAVLMTVPVRPAAAAAQDDGPPSDVARVTIRCRVDGRPAACTLALRNVTVDDTYYDRALRDTPIAVGLPAADYELLLAHGSTAQLVVVRLVPGWNPDVVVLLETPEAPTP